MRTQDQLKAVLDGATSGSEWILRHPSIWADDQDPVDLPGTQREIRAK